jgi:hypothetical protein
MEIPSWADIGEKENTFLPLRNPIQKDPKIEYITTGPISSVNPLFSVLTSKLI